MNISATKLPIFIRKHYLLHELLLINIQLLTTKYFSFQYSIAYCSQALRRPAHRARETVHLLINSWNTSLHHSSSVASKQSWPSTTRFGEAAGACVPMKRSGSAVHVFELPFDFEHTVEFWTQTLGVLTSCYSHWRTLDSQSRLCIVDTYAFEWPY